MKHIYDERPFEKARELTKNKVMFYPSQPAVGTHLQEWQLETAIQGRWDVLNEIQQALYLCLN